MHKVSNSGNKIVSLKHSFWRDYSWFNSTVPRHTHAHLWPTLMDQLATFCIFNLATKARRHNFWPLFAQVWGMSSAQSALSGPSVFLFSSLVCKHCTHYCLQGAYVMRRNCSYWCELTHMLTMWTVCQGALDLQRIFMLQQRFYSSCHYCIQSSNHSFALV